MTITAPAISAPWAISSPSVAVVEPLDDQRELQADQDEERRVEEEDQDLPDRVPLDPGGRSRELGGEAAHVDADRHGGEHAGDADRLGRQVREVGGDEGDRDLDRRVVEPAAHGGDDRADADADRDPADRADDELAARLQQAEAAGDDGRHRELVGDEGGAVVDQALALDDRDDPVRDAQLAADRGRRDGIGGRDDRAEDERRRPVEAEHVVGDGGDADHRRQDEPDRKQRDRPDVSAKLAKRREERRRVEDRRQEDQEDEVRVELDLRRARHERRARRRRSPAGSGTGSAGTALRRAAGPSPARDERQRNLEMQAQADGVERLVAAEHRDRVAGCERSHAVARRVRGRADVGEEHAPRGVQQLLWDARLALVHVEPRGADLAGSRAPARAPPSPRACPRAVLTRTAWALIRSSSAAADQMAGRLAAGSMEAHDVRALQELGELDLLGAQLPLGIRLRRAGRVEDRAGERADQLRVAPPDPPEPDDAEGARRSARGRASRPDPSPSSGPREGVSSASRARRAAATVRPRPARRSRSSARRGCS